MTIHVAIDVARRSTMTEVAHGHTMNVRGIFFFDHVQITLGIPQGLVNVIGDDIVVNVNNIGPQVEANTLLGLFAFVRIAFCG